MVIVAWAVRPHKSLIYYYRSIPCSCVDSDHPSYSELARTALRYFPRLHPDPQRTDMHAQPRSLSDLWGIGWIDGLPRSSRGQSTLFHVLRQGRLEASLPGCAMHVSTRLYGEIKQRLAASIIWAIGRPFPSYSITINQRAELLSTGHSLTRAVTRSGPLFIEL